jgi:peroxiredoxin
MQDDLLTAGAQILGISVDSFAAAKQFAGNLELNFPLLGDWPKYETGKAYGVFMEDRSIHARVTFVVDLEGIVRARIAERDPAQHAPMALEAIRSLSAS